MSLSDCLQCWDTPCTCGWDYRNWSIEALDKHAQMFLRIIEFKKQSTNLNLSDSFHQAQTDDDRRLMEYIGAWKKKE